MTQATLPQMTTQHVDDLFDFTENNGFKMAEDIVRYQIWPEVIGYMDSQKSLVKGIRLMLSMLDQYRLLSDSELLLSQLNDGSQDAPAAIPFDDVETLVRQRDLFANAVEKDIEKQVHVTSLFLLLFCARELMENTEQLAEANEGEMFEQFKKEAGWIALRVQNALKSY